MQRSTGVVDEADQEGKDRIMSSPVAKLNGFTLNFIHNHEEATENASI